MSVLYIKNAYKNIDNDIMNNENITSEKELVAVNNIFKTRYITQYNPLKNNYEVEQLERFSLVIANMMEPKGKDLNIDSVINLGTARFEELMNNKTNIPSNNWIDIIKENINNEYSKKYLNSLNTYIEEGTEKNFLLMKFNELNMVTNGNANHIDHAMNMINSLLTGSENNSFYNNLKKYKHILIANNEKVENAFNGNNALSIISDKKENDRVLSFSEDIMGIIQNSVEIVAEYYTKNSLAKKMPAKSFNKKIKEIREISDDFKKIIGENEFSEKIDKMCKKNELDNKKDNVLKMNF